MQHVDVSEALLGLVPDGGDDGGDVLAEALAQQQGIQLDKRKIVLDEPIKQTGLYTVKCKLGYEINADLKVEVKEA